MGKRLWSVFTDDMDHCYFTGSPYVERHHIFESRKGFKKKSERRGFAIPLRPDLHLSLIHISPLPGRSRNDIICV